MAKANKKALSKKMFEIATMGKVIHPLHRDVKFRQELKHERRRMERHIINLSRFKRSTCAYCKPKVDVDDNDYSIRSPKHLPFSGGE